METLYFFLYLWVIFALMDPDPATQINADTRGSGAFLTLDPDSGSGKGFFPDPGSWIPDPNPIFFRA
jgi:hypothetical protein